MDIWEVLSTECREEVVLVDSDDLIDTLDKYLKKHRYESLLSLMFESPF